MIATKIDPFLVATRIDPQIIMDIESELERGKLLHPNYPTDPLRRTAIMCEEAGEALREALDLTNPNSSYNNKRDLRHETIQTAAMAIRLLQAMMSE